MTEWLAGHEWSWKFRWLSCAWVCREENASGGIKDWKGIKIRSKFDFSSANLNGHKQYKTDHWTDTRVKKNPTKPKL